MRPSLRAWPFIWGALGTGLAFTAVYVVFVRSYIGQVIDERAFAGAEAWNGDLIDVARAFLDALPIAAVAAGALVAFAIVLVRRNWLVATVAVGAALAANVSTQVLKYTILSRPEKGVDVGLANSLPSGHTAVAAATALVVFLVSSPRFRPMAATIGSLFTIVAGASTLLDQWHRPSDVIAAMLVVAFWACLAGVVLAGLRLPPAHPPARGRLLALRWAAAVCSAGAVVALTVTYFSVQAGSEHLFIAYAGGVSAIAAAGLLLAVIGNRLYAALS